MRFKVWRLVNNYSQSLAGVEEENSPKDADNNLYSITPSGKKAQKTLNRNNLAVEFATTAFATEDMINKVHKTRTVEHPGGLMHLIVQELMEENYNKDQINKVEALHKLMCIKLNPGRNLKKIF